jgi:hypothetical protein
MVQRRPSGGGRRPWSEYRFRAVPRRAFSIVKVGWPESGNAAKSRRAADRAVSVRSQRGRDNPRRKNGAAAAAAAASDAGRIVGVVNRAERVAVRGRLVHQPVVGNHVGKRRHTEWDCASGDQPLHNHRVALRQVALERLVTARRRIALDLNLVFHRKRQSSRQTQSGPASPRAINRAGRCPAFNIQCRVVITMRHEATFGASVFSRCETLAHSVTAFRAIL